MYETSLLHPHLINNLLPISYTPNSNQFTPSRYQPSNTLNSGKSALKRQVSFEIHHAGGEPLHALNIHWYNLQYHEKSDLCFTLRDCSVLIACRWFNEAGYLWHLSSWSRLYLSCWFTVNVICGACSTLQYCALSSNGMLWGHSVGEVKNTKHELALTQLLRTHCFRDRIKTIAQVKGLEIQSAD